MFKIMLNRGWQTHNRRIGTGSRYVERREAAKKDALFQNSWKRMKGSNDTAKREVIPVRWACNSVVPNLQKGDTMVCQNYRGISKYPY